MKRHQHGKNRLAVLARGDAPRGEALAVPHAIDVVDDRHLGIAGEQEIGVHGMRRPRLHVAHGGRPRLADHLAAEYALPARLRAVAAEQIDVEPLEIEKIEQILDGRGGGGHRCGRYGSNPAPNLLCWAEFDSEGAKSPHAQDPDKIIKPTFDRRRWLCRPGAGDRATPGAGKSFTVTVVDPALAARGPRTRALRRSRRPRAGYSTRSGSGDAVADNAQPILDMVVTDTKLDDAVRPTFLTFGGEVEEGEPFAHMIENRH